jgi:hypothetical protein
MPYYLLNVYIIVFLVLNIFSCVYSEVRYVVYVPEIKIVQGRYRYRGNKVIQQDVYCLVECFLES